MRKQAAIVNFPDVRLLLRLCFRYANRESSFGVSKYRVVDVDERQKHTRQNTGERVR